MSKPKTKSARFIALLPEIYKKLIAEGYGHLETSLWLKDEYNLDLVGKNKDGKHFSNYLSLYGDIKTAKETYKAVYSKKSIAENWLNDAQTAHKTRPRSAVVTQAVTNSETVVEDAQSPPESSVRISQTIRKPKTTNSDIPDIDSLMNGYDGNRLTTKGSKK